MKNSVIELCAALSTLQSRVSAHDAPLPESGSLPESPARREAEAASASAEPGTCEAETCTGMRAGKQHHHTKQVASQAQQTPEVPPEQLSPMPKAPYRHPHVNLIEV